MTKSSTLKPQTLTLPSTLHLPPAPAHQQKQPVMAWSQAVTIDTYAPHPPDKNPMFLEKRVYQGSSGKVYPLPFYNRIADHKTPASWEAVHLENRYLRLMMLPQIGGRIHIALDKTNGYDFIYRQNVIKPALVGLAGPWISGGIEFNWPQHHRPGTFMPADVHIEEHDDGSKTVWLSEHDPMNRLKGMHGVCLHQDKAYIELKVRLYNRTETRQTFLWWANVATRVHELYQSFFPPDVFYIADHAKRAMSLFPLCQGHYYGVDYGLRSQEGVPAGDMPRQFVPPAGRYAPNDLSWYANIPVPTSYMAMGSKEDFFGGYDHGKQAGIVHIASHHISPGKKQWTWGNHEFGYAWDRNLTDGDGPYIEIMAGVYTDNQPDFSFLEPGETRTFSQYWYPIQAIGPAQHANLEAALALRLQNGKTRVGLSVSAAYPQAVITLTVKNKAHKKFTRDLAPDAPFVQEIALPRGTKETDLKVTVTEQGGQVILSYQPKALKRGEVPPPATEPGPPTQIASTDELYITGLHLDQYRHATRAPVPYWREALKRDPLDSRCNNAMGLWHYRRGEFTQAEGFFRKAIERHTRRNPNPSDGEAYYHLGLTLRRLGREEEAYDALYKSTWNRAWQGPAYHAIAELDARRGQWETAIEHLRRACNVNVENSKARNLLAVALCKLGRADEAEPLIRQTLRMDPLDFWAQHLLGQDIACDTQVRLDLALDMAAAGLYAEAILALSDGKPEPYSGTAPLLEYYRGYLWEKVGQKSEANRHFQLAAKADPSYCFPARLQEIEILQAAMRARPNDARAHYYLGNLYYDRRRYAEAIHAWETAAKLDASFPTVWRNLGIGYFNFQGKPAKARHAYEQAVQADPKDARLAYERDQLWKRVGETPRRRIAELGKCLALVEERDDLALEYCALLNQTGRHEEALALLQARRFQPWEGGEGVALGQHVRTHVALGRGALAKGDAELAREHFSQALASPENLGEAKHLLANQSDLHYWMGCAYQALGEHKEASRHWNIAASFEGDFQEMSVRAYSEMTYYQALALRDLGRKTEAKQLLRKLLAYAKDLEQAPAQIDYFATSLPTMLLFDDDLQARQTTTARFMQAQALLGMGQAAAGRKLLADVLKRDPNHALAQDLAEG